MITDLDAELLSYKKIVQGMGPTRSAQQNRYWHGVVVKYAKEVFRYAWGQKMTSSVCHDTLKALFLGIDVVNHKTGECVRIGQSTKRLDVVQFGELIESVQAWAWEEAQISIPSPNEEDLA